MPWQKYCHFVGEIWREGANKFYFMKQEQK